VLLLSVQFIYTLNATEPTDNFVLNGGVLAKKINDLFSSVQKSLEVPLFDSKPVLYLRTGFMTK
jgi:hypothetical protein